MLAAYQRLRPFSDDPAVFSAVLRPHRSLGDDDFEMAVTTMLALSIFAGVAANSMGAWPIGAALCLAGLLTASLFVAWRAGLDRCEEVRLRGHELCVRRYRKGRLVDQRRFGLDRTRLIRRDDPDHGCLGLCLERHGSRYCIAADLPPAERDRFARGLAAAAEAAGRFLPVVSVPFGQFGRPTRSSNRNQNQGAKPC